MKNKSTHGASVLIIVAIFIAIFLVGIAALIELNKKKSIELSIANEYNIRTYYVALAGINECIASRMTPRTNSVTQKINNTHSDYLKLSRISDSGIIRSNPYSKNDKDIIGKYTYVSYLGYESPAGIFLIDNISTPQETEKYLVYSKGTSKLPNGTEDSVIIKAVFDLNRFDDDIYNADELESFEVLPATSGEGRFAENLIKRAIEDKTPPMVRELKYDTFDGPEIVVGLQDSNDVLTLNDIPVRSKITLTFTEPVDPRFLEGIRLKNVNSGNSVADIDKVAISPKNTDVIILPGKKKDGKILDYASKYLLEISDVVDYNGNTLPSGVKVYINTQGQNYTFNENLPVFDDNNKKDLLDPFTILDNKDISKSSEDTN